MTKPNIFIGGLHQDERGTLSYNNDFNVAEVKRIYIIENAAENSKRGWRGHRIEKRWFSAVNGSFTIHLIQPDNWETPSKNLKPLSFDLDTSSFDILYVPTGYISCIESIKIGSRLLVMADNQLGELDDEYSFPLDYFD